METAAVALVQQHVATAAAATAAAATAVVQQCNKVGQMLVVAVTVHQEDYVFILNLLKDLQRVAYAKWYVSSKLLLLLLLLLYKNYLCYFRDQ